MTAQEWREFQETIPARNEEFRSEFPQLGHDLFKPSPMPELGQEAEIAELKRMMEIA